MKYGPNTTEVERLIEQVRTMTPEQARQLRDVWENEFDRGMNNARSEAKIAAWDAARRTDLYDAWAATQRDRIVLHSTAWNAARDALLATLVRNQITEDQYRTLLGAWPLVMG